MRAHWNKGSAYTALLGTTCLTLGIPKAWQTFVIFQRKRDILKMRSISNFARLNTLPSSDKTFNSILEGNNWWGPKRLFLCLVYYVSNVWGSRWNSVYEGIVIIITYQPRVKALLTNDVIVYLSHNIVYSALPAILFLHMTPWIGSSKLAASRISWQFPDR